MAPAKPLPGAEDAPGARPGGSAPVPYYGPLGPVYDQNGIFIAPAQAAIDPERPAGPWDHNGRH